jgi:class 3 adenylate cyclase
VTQRVRHGETRKLAAILVADVVGYGRLGRLRSTSRGGRGSHLARLRDLRSNLIDPAIAAHHARVAKRTADGICSTGTRQLRHWDHNRDDRIMAEYGLPSGPHPQYEVDHLVPLCLGGADSDANLWPEPRRSIEPTWNAERKDELEARLCSLACSGQPDVGEAQREISED